MGKTLRRYLLREIGGAFLAGIAVFTAILFLLRVLDLIEMIFARGVPASLVARLLAAILPSFLEATLPMAFLLGVVAALGRLAADRETVALRAAGLGVWQLLPTVLLLAAPVAAATLALSMTARPWGHREIERTAFEIAKTRASAALRPRFFNTEFERMVVWVDHVDADSGDLVGVLLSDERGRAGRSTVLARRGRVGGREESGGVFLQLLDGTSVVSREASADIDVTAFDSLEVSLELRTARGGTRRADEPAARWWSELREDLGGSDATAIEAGIEIHRRLAIAAATLLLALLGTALGYEPGTATRTRAVVASVLSILVFYALLTSAVATARAGSVVPGVALWAPNAVLALAAAWALLRCARDRSVLPRVALPGFLRRRRRPA